MDRFTFWKQPFHQARRILAKSWLRPFSRLRIIGVTGSYGKTTTTRAVTQVLAEKYKVLSTDINLDTVYNLPITILKLRPKHQILVLEYGVDQPGEMDFHLKLVKPQIGVLTGLTPVHSDEEHLGSFANVIREKSKLIENLPDKGLALLNWDNEYIREINLGTRAEIIRYGSDSKKCDWWLSEAKVGLDGNEFEISRKDRRDHYWVKTKLIGSHFGQAVLAAAIIGNWFGLSWEQIRQGLGRLIPLKGRMSLEAGPGGTILLNDSLRANPASTLAGLQTLVDLPARRKIAILGEMGELGDYAIEAHRQTGQKVAELKIDYLVGVGPLHQYSIKAAKESGMKPTRLFWAKDVQEAASQLKKIIKTGDLLYLKGSLLRHIERVILLLEGKKVCCQRVVCDHYHSCSSCSWLKGNSALV